MEERNIEMQEEKSISFGVIFILLKKFWLQVACIIVACTLIAGIVSIFIAKPSYKASASIMVSYVADSYGSTGNAANDQNALNLSLKLVGTVSDFINKDIVADNVKKAKDQMAEEGIKSNVEVNYRKGLSISFEEDSLILTVTYKTTTGGKQAVETVNQVINSLITVADEYEENGKPKFPTLNDRIKIVDEAQRYSVSQSWPKYVLLGFAIGVVGAIAFIIIEYMLDDTIRSKTDLERITGFKAIAFIEDIDSVN